MCIHIQLASNVVLNALNSAFSPLLPLLGLGIYANMCTKRRFLVLESHEGIKL